MDVAPSLVGVVLLWCSRAVARFSKSLFVVRCLRVCVRVVVVVVVVVVVTEVVEVWRVHLRFEERI